MTLKDRIELLNKFIDENNPTQSEWGKDIIFDFSYDIFPEDTEIKIVYESKVDEHRWYGLQDMVFKLLYNDEIEYVKTTLVTQSYSATQSFGDINHKYSKFKIVYPKIIETTIYE